MEVKKIIKDESEEIGNYCLLHLPFYKSEYANATLLYDESGCAFIRLNEVELN